MAFIGYYSFDQIPSFLRRPPLAVEAQSAFISYSREDSEFALKLAGDLKAAGAAVWLDQLDIAPGQRWARAVEDALNGCARMLVILSPTSVNSRNVEDEVSFAIEEQKTVIPVLYRDCKIPFRLRPFQFVDFRADYAGGLKRLLGSLAAQPLAQSTLSAPIASEGGIALDRSLGGSWKAQNSGTSASLESVAFVSAQSGWAVGSDGTILHTEDSGARWQAQSSGKQDNLYSVSFVSAHSGWAVGANGTILHTEDGGRSWQKQASGKSKRLQFVAFVAAELGWAATGDDDTILRTEDGGRSWQAQSNGTKMVILFHGVCDGADWLGNGSLGHNPANRRWGQKLAGAKQRHKV